MEKITRAGLLLLTMFCLWVLHTSAQRFSDFLPLYKPYGEIQIPWTQALNQLIGASLSLSGYTCLYLTLDGRVSLSNTLIFLFCSYFVIAGHGIHSTCVVEQAVMAETDSMHELVDFLHVKVSHNMFVSGFYGLLALMITKEVSKVMEWLKVKQQKGELSKVILKCNSPMCGLIFQWFWPILMGWYFSSFSRQTGTLVVTLIFYAWVIIYSLMTYSKLVSLGISLSSIYTLLQRRLIVFGSLSKAALFGTPLALLYSISW